MVWCDCFMIAKFFNLGIYVIVLDGTGVCPNGYSPISNETECKALAGQIVSDSNLSSFETSRCHDTMPPPQTCFAYTDNKLYFVNNDCGQNPAYDRHRIVCKREGNPLKDN